MKSFFIVITCVLSYMSLLPLQLKLHFSLPFDGAIYALMLIVSAYTGASQIATFNASTQLPKGTHYEGSYKKLLTIVILLFILQVISIYYQELFTLKSLNIQLPLEKIMVTLGLTASMFVGGNKANIIAKEKGED